MKFHKSTLTPNYFEIQKNNLNKLSAVKYSIAYILFAYLILTASCQSSIKQTSITSNDSIATKKVSSKILRH